MVAGAAPCARRLDPEPAPDLAGRAVALRDEPGWCGTRSFGYACLVVSVGQWNHDTYARRFTPDIVGRVRMACRVGVGRVHRAGVGGGEGEPAYRACVRGVGGVGLFFNGLRLGGAVRLRGTGRTRVDELGPVVGDVRVLHRVRGVARRRPQQAAALPLGELRGGAREGRNLLRPRTLAALACSGALVHAARLVPPGDAPRVRDGYAFSGAVPRTLALLATRFGASSRGLLLYGYSAGGSLVWRTMEGGHGLGASALGLARAFFGAVASGAPCACWGEDGTWRVLERERIDPEYRSPLYTPAFAELWRRAR